MSRAMLKVVSLALPILFLSLTATGGIAQDLRKVRLGQSALALSNLPIWAARATQTFKDQGLQLEWAVVPGGDPNALAALDSGDLDIVALGAEGPLQSIIRGQPYEIVMQIMGKMTLQLIASDDFMAKKGVSPSDPLPKRLAVVKDMTLGVAAVRGTQDLVGRWLADQGSPTADKDLKIAQIGSPQATRAALQNHQIDGYILSPPEGNLAEQGKYGEVLVDLAADFPKLRDFPYIVLVAKKPIDAAKRELVIKTIKAIAAGGAALNSDTAKITAEIQKQFFSQLDLSIVTAAVNSMKSGIKPRIDAAGLANFLEFSSETGSGNLGRQFDPVKSEGDAWTNEYVDEALK